MHLFATVSSLQRICIPDAPLLTPTATHEAAAAQPHRNLTKHCSITPPQLTKPCISRQLNSTSTTNRSAANVRWGCKKPRFAISNDASSS